VPGGECKVVRPDKVFTTIRKRKVRDTSSRLRCRWTVHTAARTASLSVSFESDSLNARPVLRLRLQFVMSTPSPKATSNCELGASASGEYNGCELRPRPKE
jgi:hypothetical protein